VLRRGQRSGGRGSGTGACRACILPRHPFATPRPDMDCRTFRDNHTSFIDGMVGDEELVAMQRHIGECPECAEHDAAIRRALLLFRNMPAIEPSPEFAERLRARLRVARSDRHRQGRTWRAGYGGPGVGTFTAIAAGVIAAGFVAVSAFDTPRSGPLVALTPVVVAPTPSISVASAIAPRGMPRAMRILVDDSLPIDDPQGIPWAPLDNPAFAASVSSGMPVWPAAVLAAQAPQLKLTNLER
jgi:anti-sigma factor RsiW